MPLLPTPVRPLRALPRRIVSVVPSQTELLWALGLEEEVVGITKFCVRPAEWFRRKVRVGGTKTVHAERVHALKPDLILANREENVREQIEELARHYPVWVSDVRHLADALGMIEQVALLVGKWEAGQQLARAIREHFEAHRPLPFWRPRRAAYFIWRKPWMVAGGDTFIHSMLLAAGFENVFAHLQRYPQVLLCELHTFSPEVILLSSEPYPFDERHLEEFQQACPQAQVMLVDGELFSWYGSRLLEAPRYFERLRAAIG